MSARHVLSSIDLKGLASSVMRYAAHGNRAEQFTAIEGGHYRWQSLGYDGAHQLVTLQVEGPDEQGQTIRLKQVDHTVARELQSWQCPR